MTLRDVFGRLLKKENFVAGKNPVTILLQDFHSGIYLLQVHHADEDQTVKIYKN